MADWELGSAVYDNGVVQIVIFQTVIVLIQGLSRLGLMRLGELDGVVLQLLQGGIVEVIEIIVVKVIHLSIGPMPRRVLCSKWVFCSTVVDMNVVRVAF